ncbi:chemotaxis protein CheB [Chloroflexota bacterium]
MVIKKDGPKPKTRQASNKTGESPKTKRVRKAISTSQKGNPDFPIVGIGSSAGGLEALQELFINMPSDTGMGFVVVSHLDPSHVSILPELLQKCTAMSVYLAKDGMAVKPNNIYVIPPNKRMGILHGKLILLELVEPHGLRLPIDFFLRALAQDIGRAAICVILSGSGTDGTMGLKAIKSENGLAIVQELGSAKYDGMPRQAIDSGMADFILRPSEIPAWLVSLAGYSRNKIIEESSTATAAPPDYLGKVFLLLRQYTKHDFSQYKPAMLHRRIERRMTVNQIGNIAGYVSFLEQHSEEAQALFKDMLISVTGFFRDKEAFVALKSRVKTLLSQRSSTAPFRIWVPGCATGEEAYSTAMIARECLVELKQDIDIQVFATDIDEDAIIIGRGGVYPIGIGIGTDLSPERLNHFFKQTGDTYVIKRELREKVVFAIHDLIKDPPFSKIDLISCRNLLIYLNSDLQARILPLLCYSLNKDGILFLGSAETIGKYSDLFSALDKKWRIYQQREGAIQNKRQVQFNPVFTNGEHRKAGGQTGKNLELPTGTFKRDMLDLVRESLRVELASALPAFLKGQETSRSKVEVEQPEVSTTTRRAQSTRISKRVTELEQELALNKENLQSTREEMETANEELQSSNEELQSTNEELETSREELQSINEELMTVNAEQTAKNDELDKTSNDLLNLLNATEIATIFLDMNLNIRRFTPPTAIIFNLIESDIGRPIQHITSNLLYDKLNEDLKKVLDTLVSKSIKVQTKEAGSYILRITPYRTTGYVVQGLVLSLIDITKEENIAQELAIIKATQELAIIKAAQELAESLVNTVRNPMIVLDRDLRVILANKSFYSMFRIVKEKTEKQLIYEIGNRQWDIPKLRELLEDILPKNTHFDDYEVDLSFPAIGHKKLLLNARRVVAVSGQKPLILLAIEEITKDWQRNKRS